MLKRQFVYAQYRIPHFY